MGVPIPSRRLYAPAAPHRAAKGIVTRMGQDRTFLPGGLGGEAIERGFDPAFTGAKFAQMLI